MEIAMLTFDFEHLLEYLLEHLKDRFNSDFSAIYQGDKLGKYADPEAFIYSFALVTQFSID